MHEVNQNILTQRLQILFYCKQLILFPFIPSFLHHPLLSLISLCSPSTLSPPPLPLDASFPVEHCHV